VEIYITLYSSNLLNPSLFTLLIFMSQWGTNPITYIIPLGRYKNMAYGYSFTPSDADFEGLSDVDATFHFTDPYSLGTTLRSFFDDSNFRDQLSDSTALITGVPKDLVLDEDDGNRHPPIQYHRKALYLEDSKTLLVTHRGLTHGIAHGTFFWRCCIKLDDMHCDEDADPTGGATVPMANVIMEPDESWCPSPSFDPSFVVLTDVSKSNRALHRDAKIWLENPESPVTQVITIEIPRTRPEIVYRVWKKEPQERETRQHPHRAVVTHEARVTIVQGRPTADGDLTLSFEEFFQRKPRPGTTEGDIILPAHDLESVAGKVWEHMGFIRKNHTI
jgi:hypothetical protein